MPQWRLRLFGGLRVEGDSETFDRFETKRSALLLARLALSRNPRLSREDLADMLWPEDFYDATRVRLRQELSRLRRALGSAEEIVKTTPEFVGLDTDFVDVDSAIFSSEVRAARLADDPEQRCDRLEEALQLVRGEFLPGLDEPWIAGERDRLAALRLEALLQVGEYRADSQRFESALALATEALEIDPINERAHMVAMRGHSGTGSLVDALGQFQKLSRLLRDERGEAPSQTAQDLLKAIQQKGAAAIGIAAVAPPLPAPIDRFFGRDAELTAISKSWQEGGSRLLTLTGPAGMGKTRLAIEAALRAKEVFDNRVYFAPLADLTSAESAPEAVLRAFGLTPTAGTPTEELLRRSAPAEDALLVVDNLERLLPDVAEFLRGLLADHPRLRILATSQQPLKLTGERVLTVGPLATQDTGTGIPPGIALLIDQAQAVRSTLGLDDSQMESFRTIAQRLEGIPLALRLAAGRFRIMTPAQMAGELEDGFALAATNAVDGPERHRTLDAAIQSSFGHLPESSVRLLAQLSSFRGWSLDQARAAAQSSDVLDELELLIDRALVSVDDSQANLRFRMLETIREFVRRKRMSAEERAAANRTQLEVMADVLLSALPEEGHGLRQEAVRGLDADIENIREAMRYAVGNEPKLAAKLYARLWQYWAIRGHNQEGIAIGRALMVLDEIQEDPVLAAGVRYGIAAMLQTLADVQDMRELLESSLDYYEQEGIHGKASLCLGRLSHLSRREGKFEEGHARIDRALEWAAKSNERSAMARAHHQRAYLLMFQAKLEEAVVFADKAREFAAHEINPYAHVASGQLAAWIHHELGANDVAIRILSEIERETTLCGDLTRMGGRAELTGRIAMEQGDYETARQCFEQSLAIWTNLGSTYQIADQRQSLARATTRCGDPEKAWELGRQSLLDWFACDDHGGTVVAVHGLSMILHDLGDAGGANRLLNACLERARVRELLFVRSEDRFVARVQAEIGGDEKDAESLDWNNVPSVARRLDALKADVDRVRVQ